MGKVGGKKKYLIGDTFGPYTIAAEGIRDDGRAVAILHCSVCNKDRPVTRDQLTKMSHEVWKPGTCTCYLVRQGRNPATIISAAAPTIESKKPHQKSVYYIGSKHGVYEIIDRKGNKVDLKCKVCNYIFPELSLTTFYGWNKKEECLCEKRIEDSKKGHAWAERMATPEQQLVSEELKVLGSPKSLVRSSPSLANRGFEDKIDIKSPMQKDDFYGTIARNGIYGDSVILAGPDLERHLKDNRSSFGKEGNTIYIIENNYEVSKLQLDRFNELNDTWSDFSGKSHSLKSNTMLCHGDILNAPSCQVIDADLMGTFKTDGSVVLSLLNKQAQLNDTYKAFIFTLSERGTLSEVGYENTIHWIEKEVFSMLDMKAKCVDKVPIASPKTQAYKPLVYKHKVLISVEKFGRVTDTLMFHYSDQKGPMITCCIIYK